MRFTCLLKNVLTSFPIPSQNSALSWTFYRVWHWEKPSLDTSGKIRRPALFLTPVLGTHLCSGILLLPVCRLCSQQWLQHSAGCWARTRVFWQGLFGVFIFRIIASSRIATCSEQCPFFGPRGGKGRRKHIFLWQMGFCFLSKFHMNIYSCLCSLTWMPGFDLRTNCPINSWMSEFNLHLSPLTFTLAFPFIIGDILTATFNKIRATESKLDYEDRPRHRGMMCDPGQCRDLKSFWIRC